MSFQVLPDGTDRRTFLKGLGAAGAVAIIGSSSAAPMVAYAAQGGASDTVIVNLFLRGGADGLDIVVPHGDDEYYNRRPSLALTSSGYDDLDGFFGLNSAFSELLPHFLDERLAFVHATGNPDDFERSHFVSQPLMDFAGGQGGWLQRALMAGNFPQGSAGLTIGGAISPSLMGPWAGTALLSIENALQAGAALQLSRPALESMYSPAPPLESAAVALAMESLDDLSMSGAMLGDGYPATGVAQALRQAAALIKTDLGVRGVAVNAGDWDHHIGLRDKMTLRGGELAAALAAFQADLGAQAGKVVTVVMTEFGREAIENGSGTEHGKGGMMMVLGDALMGLGGGKVHTDPWPGLAIDQLDRGRFLEVTTDFRSVCAELIENHLGVSDMAAVFPGFAPQRVGLFDAGAIGPGDVNSSGTFDEADVRAILADNVGLAQENYTPNYGDTNNDGTVDLLDALRLARELATPEG